MGWKWEVSERERELGLAYGNAGKINGREEEVDLGPDRLDAYRPDLCRHDRADGAPGRREVETPRADRCGEDLFVGVVISLVSRLMGI